MACARLATIPSKQTGLERNPLLRFCLDHLNREGMRAHEQDLELATPDPDQTPAGEGHYNQRMGNTLPVRTSRVVGGDYCEIAGSADGKSLFFAVGDVAGKGVAASC